MKTCTPRPSRRRAGRRRRLLLVSTLVVGGAVLPLAWAACSPPTPAYAGNSCSGACYMHNAEQSLDRIAGLSRNRAGGSRECEETREWEDYAARVEALALAHTLQNEWVAVAHILPANIRAA